MLAFLIKGDNKFNNFFGTEYIISKGYGAVIASSVRFFGDCYEVPRIKEGSENVKISEAVSKELNCDHLVTSWAIRLNHPESTWPSIKAMETLSRNIDTTLGNISHEHLLLLINASNGIFHIDFPHEANARYERPYYDDYSKTIYEIWASSKRNDVIETLNRRIDSGKEILPVLANNLRKGMGDKDCLRHWINGIELCILRSEQTVAMIDSYTNGINRAYLEKLLIRNNELMKEFEELWSESVTDFSLEQEKEVKFLRDIRIIENLLCE